MADEASERLRILASIREKYREIAKSATDLEGQLYETKRGEFVVTDTVMERIIRGYYAHDEEDIQQLRVDALGHLLAWEHEDNNDPKMAGMILRRNYRILEYLRAPKYSAEPAIIELDVPSGKIVFSDSLFTRVPDLDETISIEYGANLKRYTEELNKETSMAYVFCHYERYLTRKADGSFAVMKQAWIDGQDEDYDEEDEETEFLPGEEPLALTTGALWAVCMIDLDKWVSYGGSTDGGSNLPDDIHDYEVVDIPPGKYRVTVHTAIDDYDFDTTSRLEYASIELVEAY